MIDNASDMQAYEHKGQEPMREGPAPMRLREGIALYVGALAVLMAMVLAWRFVPWFPGLLLVGCYLALGAVLTRIMLTRLVEWHPVYDTIGAVVDTKIRFVVFWPVKFGLLLTQLVINRVL